MTDLKKLYQQLDEYSKDFSDWKNTERFIGAVEQIVDIGNSESIKVLLSYFDDNDSTDYVYERLSGLIESYEGQTYIKELLLNLKILIPQATEWASNLIVILLNSEEDIKILKEYLFLAPEPELLKILDMIYARSVKHRPIIDELKKLLQEK